MNAIGIDPGKNGAIALVQDSFGHKPVVIGMPDTENGVLTAIESLVSIGLPVNRVVLEFVRSSPQMGRASAFTFGCGYGGLRMALTSLGLAYDEVIPRRWQKAMGCLSGGDKNVTKRRAQELFPSLKITHKIADALLIAEYGRRLASGEFTRTV